MPSISRTLAQWVATLNPRELPEAVLDRARGVTLQALSSALLGSGFDESRQALAIMREEAGGGSGSATVLVQGQRLTPSGAAYVNAEQILCGGKWDTFRMVIHAGCAVVPAALAAAEAAQCSGLEYLAAVAAGYEVTERLARDVVPTVLSRGFHPGPVFGIFGAAVAIARIQGLDAAQVHDVLGHCVNLASGNLEGARSGGRAIREGAAVRNAFLAVALARQGVRGGETVFEGEAGFYHAYAGSREVRLTHSFGGEQRASLDRITAGLGEEWVFLETLYRIYSTPGYNIAHIEVAADLCRREGIRAEDVEQVESVVNWLETKYPSPDFPSRHLDTQPGRGTAHFYLAHAILTGGFPLLKNVERGVGEPDPPGIPELMARIRLVPEKLHPPFAPRVTIRTRDGRSLSQQGTGREFIFGFDQLARRLAEISGGLPIPAERYAALTAECAQLHLRASVDALVALTLPV